MPTDEHAKLLLQFRNAGDGCIDLRKLIPGGRAYNADRGQIKDGLEFSDRSFRGAAENTVCGDSTDSGIVAGNPI